MKPSLQQPQEDAKKRILDAAVKLFAKKGYDGTRVNEIAEAANVTKGLIYYYFKSKEEILDCLLHLLLEDFTALAMEFVRNNIIPMIKSGELDIEPDRLHFSNEEAIMGFLRNTYGYFEEALDFALKNRDILRILMLESLKDGKYRRNIFQALHLLKGEEENPVYKTLAEVDRDFTYSDDLVCIRFFFSLVPLVSFAIYYDDFQKLNILSGEELRASFLRSSLFVLNALVSGRGILLPKKEVES